jgi:hypothetical protein
MAALTNYTDTTTVRGLLGVGPIEVPDAMLQDMRLEDRVLVDLAEWLPTHTTLYSTWTGNEAPEPDVTYARLLRLFVGYYCAAQVAAFQLAIPQAVSDGKNALKRFEGVDVEALAGRMAGEAAYYRQRLEAALASKQPSKLVLMGRAVPSYDPVTGGGGET